MKKKNVVTIGGGTGSFVLLSGLKKYSVNITAILSMADDGGSTGLLRDELGVLPPGDVRQCLVALSESSSLMRNLMGYRFENGGLKGHSFGNIFISALEKTAGSFVKATEEVGKILNIVGEVMPVSEGDMRLLIRLNNGKVLKGETELDHSEEIRKIGIKEVRLVKKVRACRQALDRIRKADFIIIGPGDLYGSLIPNFLVDEIRRAIQKSKARLIFNCNLTNRKGQTDGYDLERYVRHLEKYLGAGRINFVTFNSKKPPKKLMDRYERKEGKGAMVEFYEAEEGKRGFRVVRSDLLSSEAVKYSKSDAISGTRALIRHDSDKLAKVLMKIINGKY
ncbi:MAG: gluconeogenesis factor YvcK family protein [Parcubacteria group bacterium]